MAVLRPSPAHSRLGGAVGVLDLLGRALRPAEAGVDRHVRLGPDLTAERHELVEPDVVGLDAFPGRVLARRPPVALTDAVLPVVAAHEVAARPAVDGRGQFLEARVRVGAPTVEVVFRHQGHGADPEASLAVAGDLQASVVGGSRSRERQRQFRVLLADLVDRNGLAIGHPAAPHQADPHGRDRGSAAENDPADVPAALDEPQPLLHQPAGLVSAGKAHDRSLLADVRPLPVHRHAIPVPDHQPRRAHEQLVSVGLALPRRTARLEERPRRRLAIDGVEELAIFQHLGPEAAVDAAAQVLDELPVHVGRDGRTGPADVDGHRRLRRLRDGGPPREDERGHHNQAGQHLYFLVLKARTVFERYSRPGRRIVEGKSGWFGESGKCWVSRQKP